MNPWSQWIIRLWVMTNAVVFWVPGGKSLRITDLLSRTCTHIEGADIYGGTLCNV